MGYENIVLFLPEIKGIFPLLVEGFIKWVELEEIRYWLLQTRFYIYVKSCFYNRIGLETMLIDF